MPLYGVSGPLLYFAWAAFGPKNLQTALPKQNPKQNPKFNQKCDQNGSPNWQGLAQEGGQERPRRGHEPKRVRSMPQQPPREPQESPRRAQGEPKESPKRAPREPQKGQKGPKRTTKGLQESLQDLICKPLRLQWPKHPYQTKTKKEIAEGRRNGPEA